MQKFGPRITSGKVGQKGGENVIRDEVSLGLNSIYFYFILFFIFIEV